MPHLPSHDKANLTKNDHLVLSLLQDKSTAQSAYGILNQLREEGFRAPLQVYRALEKLMAAGLVHRLESLNAFIACNRHGCEKGNHSAFMICDQCGTIEEIDDSALIAQLAGLAQTKKFTLTRSVIELRGFCNHCQA